jgi:hypothetical protein
MEDREDKIDSFVTMALGIFVAGYFAIMLEYVANVDLGFSFEQIRGAAMFTALMLAMPTALGFLSKEPDQADKPR